ncbi:MAG: hypothetical protein ACRDPT_09930 [Streptomycetales bacterium]
MRSIDVEPLEAHRYVVTISGSGDGRGATRHTVTVPGALIDELGGGRLDEADLVRESFVFLLEREPASAILAAFSLDVISRYFPEYVSEMRARLTGA